MRGMKGSTSHWNLLEYSGCKNSKTNVLSLVVSLLEQIANMEIYRAPDTSLTNDRLIGWCQAFELAYQLQIESIDQRRNHDHYPTDTQP